MVAGRPRAASTDRLRNRSGPRSATTTSTHWSTTTPGFAYSEVLPDEKGATCAAFLLRAAQAFTQAGIAVIERVITDNHMSYKRSNDMRDAVTVLGAKHLFIKPHCPWQNGKVERYNRTLATEWAYRRPFTTNTARTAALAPWLDHYNNQRRHSALGGQPPITRLPPTS